MNRAWQAIVHGVTRVEHDLETNHHHLILRISFCDPMDCSLPGFSVHGDSPGKNTGVGRHFLLQGIFLTQELNPGLL